MVQILLGGTLIVGASLLAAASYSSGALIAFETAAQVVGWLWVFSMLATLCLRRPQRHSAPGEFMIAAVTFLSGGALLYAAYFDASESPPAPVRHAAAETAVVVPAEFKLVGGFPPIPTPASAQTFTQFATKQGTEFPVRVAQVSFPRMKDDPCFAFTGVEALQCVRCVRESGLSLLMCHERARLDYCEDRQAQEPDCPSAIPYSPPN